MNRLDFAMLSYAGTYTVASYVQQKFIQKQELVKLAVLKHATVGSLVIAPSVFFWVQLMNRKFPLKTIKYSMIKALLSNTTIAPVQLIGFFAARCILDGRPHEIKDEIKQKFVQTCVNQMLFWPPLSFINYRFVPLRFQPLYFGTLSFIWSTYLCYVKEQDLKHNGIEVVEASTNVKATDS